MTISEMALDTISNLRPDLNVMYEDTRGYSLGEWRARQQAMVTGTGMAAAIIPVAHLAGVAADVLFLVNRMSVCSYGIGAIYGRGDNLGNFLEEEDFAVVLSLWAGGSDDAELTAALSAKAAADMAVKIHSKAGLKILAKTMTKSSGLLIGSKFGGKFGAKIGAKFGAKLGGKVAAGLVPFLGAAVGGGINLWFITSIADAAERFYRFKCEVGRRL